MFQFVLKATLQYSLFTFYTFNDLTASFPQRQLIISYDITYNIKNILHIHYQNYIFYSFFPFFLLHYCVQLELDCENNDKLQYYDNTNSASRFSKNQTCYSLIITLFLNTVTFELPFFLTWKTHAQILHAKSLQPTSRFSFIPSSWKWRYAEVEGV